MYKTLITEDRLKELVRIIDLTPSGLCAEIGVYKGGSLKYMSDKHRDREFWGIDTFEGLPGKDWNNSEPHNPGDFNDTSFEVVKEYLKDNKKVSLIQGYFPACIPLHEYGEITFSFVHVDTDFYQSVKNAIEYFYPLLKPGGIMVFDDYQWDNCPGVKRALDESGLKYYPTRAEYQAYVIKP